MSSSQRFSLFVLAAALVLLGTSSSTAVAQSYFAADELSAHLAELDENSQFGLAMAAQPGRALIGAPRRDVEDALGAGAAFVYREVGGVWSLEREFVSPMPETGGLFGTSVAIGGGKAVVGAPREDRTVDDGGVVYVFDRNFVNWELEAVLEADDVEPGDLFGTSLALDGDVLVVGAPFEDTAGLDSGAIYVFLRLNGEWVQRQKITNPFAGTSDDHRFGYSVGISGTRIVVGAPRGGVSSRGRAYVYVASGNQFVLEKEIGPADLREADQFGVSVDIEGDRIVGGALLGDDGSQINIGAAYVYKRNLNDWQLEQKLRHGHTGTGYYGNTVSMDGDRVAVGAYLEPDGSATGAVYTFERTELGWSDPSRLGASEIGAGQRFGFTVVLDGDSMFASAPLDGSYAPSGGSVWELEVRNCREGGVNRTSGSVANVLFVNGDAGNTQRVVMADATGPIIGTISLPPQGGNGKHFIHANAGEPSSASLVVLPSQLGAVCFQVLLTAGATPIGVWNAIGKEHKLGESMYLDGTPIADPPSAPALFLNLPNGDATNLPPGTTITLQGAIVDPGSPSPRGVSITNAVILITT